MPTKSKSQVLLESYLDEQQLKDLHNHGHFFVITKPRNYVFQLRDGSSIVQWHERGQGTAFHVWACDSMGRGYDKHTSLLTQLLFLTSSNPNDILDVACNQGVHWDRAEGVPLMKGYHADPEGVKPPAYLY